MIQAKLGDGTYLMGLDAENIRRLMSGDDLVINLRKIGGHEVVRVTYGNTLQDVVRRLEKQFGPLPPASPLPDEMEEH
jgi:hypothetical protein